MEAWCSARPAIGVPAAAGGLRRPRAAPQAPAVLACAGSRPALLRTCQQQSSSTLLRQQHGQLAAAAPRQRRQHVAAAAAAVAAAPATQAAASAFWPALVQAWNINPSAVLLAAGACILGLSLSIFLLAAIPTMLALRRSAHAATSLLATLEAEVPDTAATLRLSGMELADCIGEMGALSTDLTEGVRASARALSSAEQGIRAAGNLAGRTVVEQLPKAQDKVEAALQERAKLDYTARVVGEAAASTRTVVQRLRFALAAGGLAQRLAWSAGRLRRGRPPAGGSVGGGSVDDMGVGVPRY